MKSLIPPLLISYHPGLPSARILLSWFSQNPSYPWCFLLVIFHPLATSLLLSYKCPLVLIAFWEELIPLPYWGNHHCISLSQIKSSLLSLTSVMTNFQHKVTYFMLCFQTSTSLLPLAFSRSPWFTFHLEYRSPWSIKNALPFSPPNLHISLLLHLSSLSSLLLQWWECPFVRDC